MGTAQNGRGTLRVGPEKQDRGGWRKVLIKVLRQEVRNISHVRCAVGEVQSGPQVPGGGFPARAALKFQEIQKTSVLPASAQHRHALLPATALQDG